MFVNRPFEPRLMVAGLARILPLSGAPERCFTQVELRNYKHKTRMEKLVKDKYSSSFFRIFINYSHKKLCDIGP